MNRAMGQVDQVTQQNASAAEELSSTAEELRHQSASLQRRLSDSRSDVFAHGGVRAQFGKRQAAAIDERKALADLDQRVG